VSANFRPISNLNNISKILERFFLHDYSPILPAHLVSIIYNQFIANIALLKPLSFTSLILSTMPVIIGSPLFCSLSASVLHSTQFTTPFFSIVSLPVSASWVPFTNGLNHVIPTVLFQLLLAPLPLSNYLHLQVFPRPVLGPILFTIYVSPIASIVSPHGVNQQQYADDTQLFVFLSHSSLSSSLCSLQRYVSSLHSWFIHNDVVLNPTKLRRQPTTPIDFHYNFHRGYGYICFTGRLRIATW